jgi:hypothetical protein
VRGGAAPAAVPAGAVASAAPSRWFVVRVAARCGAAPPRAARIDGWRCRRLWFGVLAAAGARGGSPLASVWLWRFWVLPLRGLVRRMVLAGVGCLGFVVVVVLGLLGFSAVGGARGFCRPFFVLAPCCHFLRFDFDSSGHRLETHHSPDAR